MNQRWGLPIAVLLCAVILVGCADSTDNFKAEADLESDPEYIEAMQLKEDYPFIEDEYTPAEIAEVAAIDKAAEDIAGKAQVSLARNAYFNTKYFKDEAGTERITDMTCYLDVGESIYAAEPTVTNSAPSDLYEFSGYQVVDYLEDGERSPRLLISGTGKMVKVLTIAEDDADKSIAIEPMGHFKDRELTLKSYYEENGAERELSQDKWLVKAGTKKEEEHKSGIVTGIKPVEDFLVTYDYSYYGEQNAYYVADASPKDYILSISNGSYRVIFPQQTPKQNPITEYSVELHKCITMTIENKAILDKVQKASIISIKWNDKPIGVEQFKAQPKIEGMQVGDKVFITVGGNYRVTGTGVIVHQANGVNGNYEYTVEIPETENTEVRITVDKRGDESTARYSSISVQNARLVVLEDGKRELQDGDETPSNNKSVTVQIQPNPGYYIAGDHTKEGITNGQRNIYYEQKMTFGKFEERRDSIIENHPATKLISLKVDISHTLGTVSAKFNKNEVQNGETLTAREGETIELTFTLTDTANYTIDRKNFLDSALHFVYKQNEVTENVTITKEHQGATIKAQDVFKPRAKGAET